MMKTPIVAMVSRSCGNRKCEISTLNRCLITSELNVDLIDIDEEDESSTQNGYPQECPCNCREVVLNLTMGYG